MSIFGKIKSAVKSAASKVKRRLFDPPKPSMYSDKEAEQIMTGQEKRREDFLKRRVAKGKSREVYKNKKTNTETAFYFNGKRVTDSPPLELFRDGYPFSRFASSNVQTVVYDRRSGSLYIQYLRKRGGGAWYRYKNVSMAEATDIYGAISKGVWVWTHLRIRGNPNGFKKSFVKNSPPPFDLPLGLNDEAVS